MYTKYYGLHEKPFEITTDPRFLFLSESHKEALAHLLYAVQEKKGFTVITGEVGTGKTTLVQTLLSRLNGSTRTAFLFNPNLGINDFFHYICVDLGLKARKRSKGDYLTQLHDFLLACYSRNENVVLIIDEAQNLAPQLLEEVRLLTNLETSKSKLLQVILIGQPELDEILNQPKFRQLKQRISVRYHIFPLNRQETEEYIKNRLTIAGARKGSIFSIQAIERIYDYSKGIPRLINIICDNALLTGYASGQEKIEKSIIGEVIKDLEGTSGRKVRKWRFFLIMLLMCISLFFFLFLGEGEILQTFQMNVMKGHTTLINFWTEI